MAAISSHPNPEPNPNFISPMLQPYLEQQRRGIQPDPPPDDESQYEVVSDDSRDSYTIPNLNPNPNPIKLKYVSFNQDYGCFATGSDRGFRIFNCDPFREIFRRDFDGGKKIYRKGTYIYWSKDWWKRCFFLGTCQSLCPCWWGSRKSS